MAVKALVWIESAILNDDMSYTPRVLVKISGRKTDAFNIVTKYQVNTAKAVLNQAISDWVTSFIQSEWRVPFDGLLDSVIIVNPLGTL